MLGLVSGDLREEPVPPQESRVLLMPQCFAARRTVRLWVSASA